jgi:hypothetical protein
MNTVFEKNFVIQNIYFLIYLFRTICTESTFLNLHKILVLKIDFKSPFQKKIVLTPKRHF